MTRTTDENQRPPRKPYEGIVGFLSSVYLFTMVAYLTLRLIFGDDFWWLALPNAFAVYTFIPSYILLGLAALIGVWRLVVRLLMIAFLGVIWFGPFFQPPPDYSPTGPRLTIATANLQGWANTRFSDIEAWILDNEFDVVALQEVPPAFIDNHLPNLIEIYPEQLPGGRTLLSRHPILESDTVVGQQRIVIDHEGREIVVYNVHLNWPLGNPPRIDLPILRTLSRYDESSRNDQIEALLDVLEEETLPYIVAGDFNMSQHSIIYSALAVVMDDSFRVTEPGLGPTWRIDLPVLRLDYVWYSPDSLLAVETELGPDIGSDHFPLISTIEIFPPGEALDLSGWF